MNNIRRYGSASVRRRAAVNSHTPVSAGVASAPASGQPLRSPVSGWSRGVIRTIGCTLGLAGLLLLSSGAALSAASIRSQDGMGYGAVVTANPLALGVTMQEFAFPGDVTLGTLAFRGSVLDGSGNIWMVPSDADKVVKVNKTNGAMTSFALPGGITGTSKFVGAAFDGTHIWLVPDSATAVVRVDVSDGSMTSFSGWPGTVTAADPNKFAGGVFDGTYIWMAPFRSQVLVKVAVATGVMTEVPLAPYVPVDFDFWGAVFDGANVWLVPFNAGSVVKIVAATDVVTQFSGWPAGFTKGNEAFTGAGFDGTNLWLAPFDATHVVKVAIADGTMTGFNGFPSGLTIGASANAYEGAMYDGSGIWMVAHNADRMLRVNPSNGAMTFDDSWAEAGIVKGGNAFAGGSFDGDRIWLAPKAAGAVVRLTSDVTAPFVTAISRQTPSGSSTNATSLIYRVTFSESVTGVDTADFQLNATGTAAGTIASVSAASGLIIDVTVSSASGDGDLRLDLKSSGTAIVDNALVAISGGFTSGETYALDHTAPVITSADTANGTYRSVFNFTVTASGSPVSFGATGLPTGLSITAGTGAIAGSPTQVGVFPVSVTATDTAGNIGIDTLTLTIAQAPLTVTGITANDKVYDGTTTATLVTGSAALVGVLSGDTVGLVTAGATGTFANKVIGVAKVVTVSGLTLNGAAAANYSLTQPTTSANITAAPLTISGMAAASKVYDTTAAATPISGGAALVGVASGDTVTINVSGVAAAFADKTVALGKTVTISGLALSGADAGNYTLTQPTTTANITAAGLTIAGVTVANKVYDGATTATANAGSATLVGVLGVDTVTFAAGGMTASFADKLVAAGKTVTISGLTLAGADAGNYSLTQPTATAAITAKALTVTGVTASNKAFDATTVATLNVSGAALSGVIVGDTVTLDTTGAAGAFDTAAVGANKTVTVTGLTIGGADVANYTLTQPTTTANITESAATVTLSNLAQTYDGSPKSVTATTGPVVGLAVSITYDGSATAPTNAGSYAVVATVTDPSYTGSANGTLVISRSTSTAVSITNTTHTFDGTPKPVTVTTTPSGLTVTVTYAGSATVPSAIGSYAVVATIADANYSGSASATLVIGPNSRLVNMSARTLVGTGSDVLIQGFVITGTGTKTVLIRGIGPTLATFSVPGVLATPTLTLVSNGTDIATNTGWSTSPDAAAIAQTAIDVSAFALPANSADSALLIALAPGSYTAKLSGVGGTTGVGLVEIYDADVAPSTARLVNLSARARVGTGSDVLIPGFVLEGDGARRYLIRAIGPTLGSVFSVPGVLADPKLTIFSGATEVATNDDWSSAANAADIVTVSAQVFAFALANGSKDAAALVTLQPGAYTVVVSGVGGTTGVALVEIYEVQE